jgi:hypothetical protein
VDQLLSSIQKTCDKVQYCIPFRHTEQFTDLFIRGFPLPGPVPDMNPAGSNVVLLRSKENMAGCNDPVARLEFTPSMPILARIDVSAAKTAEPNANPNHILVSSLSFACP